MPGSGSSTLSAVKLSAMPDMLVQLLKIQPAQPLIDRLRKEGVIIRRANAHEITPVREFVLKTFAQTWADETLVAFTRQPITLFIAIENGRVIGFGAYECTRRCFFGPTGVHPKHRGRYIGK